MQGNTNKQAKTSIAQLVESKQDTYAYSKNGLEVTKAYQEADVPRLNNLAMAIVGYGGHRVVAHVVNLLGTVTDDAIDEWLTHDQKLEVVAMNLLVAGEKLGDVFSEIAARDVLAPWHGNLLRLQPWREDLLFRLFIYLSLSSILLLVG
ncbi:clustered mitochondria protein [Tanacetum coccineum]